MSSPIQYTRAIGSLATAGGSGTQYSIPCLTDPVTAARVLVSVVLMADRPATSVVTSTGVAFTLDKSVTTSAARTLQVWSALMDLGQQPRASQGDFIRLSFSLAASLVLAKADEFSGLRGAVPLVDGNAGAAGIGLTPDSGYASEGANGDLLIGVVGGDFALADNPALNLGGFWTINGRLYAQTTGLWANYAGIAQWPLPANLYKITGTFSNSFANPPWGAILQGYLPENRLQGSPGPGQPAGPLAGVSRTSAVMAALLTPPLVGVARILRNVADFGLPVLTNPNNMPVLPTVGVGKTSGTLGLTFHGACVGVGKTSGRLVSIPPLPPTTLVGVGLTVGQIGKTFRGSLFGVALTAGKLSPSPIPLLCPQGFFCRIGRILALINAVNLHRGDDVVNRVGLIRDEYDNADQLPDAIFQRLASDQSARRSFLNWLQGLAEETLIYMANASEPLPQQTVPLAMALLIKQMLLRGHTILKTTVGYGWTAIKKQQANVGNPAIVLSMKDDRGLDLENVFAEHIVLTCTQDAQLSGTPGQESLQALSEFPETDELNFDWPLGSGANVSVTATDEGDGGKLRGNSLLKNGGFDTPNLDASNQPLNWTTLYGAWAPANPSGNLFLSARWKGNFSVLITGQVGDDKILLPDDPANQVIGHPPVELRQVFPAKTLRPLTTYILNLWLAVDGAPGSNDGTINVALVSPSTSAPPTRAEPYLHGLLDDVGTPNFVSAPLGPWPTQFAPLSVAFRTPRQIAGDEAIAIRITKAIPPGRSIWIDSLTLRVPTRLYPGGPALMVAAGSIPMIAGDAWQIQVLTDRAGKLQMGCERLFGMRSINGGSVIPSSASPDVPDSLTQ